MTRLQPRGGGGERGFVRTVIPALLLLVALAVGLLGVYGVGLEIWRGTRTYGWQAAECTILDTGEVEDSGDYRFEVTYTWRWQGNTYRGDRLRPSYSGSSDVSDAYRLAARYPVGATVGCWVDPAAPEQATLERYRFRNAFWLLVPLLFVAIGGGGMVMMVRLRRGGGGGEPAVPPVTAADAKFRQGHRLPGRLLPPLRRRRSRHRGAVLPAAGDRGLAVARLGGGAGHGVVERGGRPLRRRRLHLQRRRPLPLPLRWPRVPLRPLRLPHRLLQRPREQGGDRRALPAGHRDGGLREPGGPGLGGALPRLPRRLADRPGAPALHRRRGGRRHHHAGRGAAPEAAARGGDRGVAPGGRG